MQLELRAQALQEEELLSAKEEELLKQEEDNFKRLPPESQEITLQLSNVEAKRQVPFYDLRLVFFFPFLFRSSISVKVFLQRCQQDSKKF